MALKPPPIGEVMQQVNELVGPAGLVDEVDRNARQLAQSALRKLDFVSRDEFDAQAAILARTRSKVARNGIGTRRNAALVAELEKAK
jgi:BMFP domain-containing protein YqiC